jgi:hypothetical protein
MTLSVSTARSAGTRPLEVVDGKTVLTCYFDVCSEVDRPDAAEGHRGVVPRWVQLANDSLAFLMKTLPRYGFTVCIESEVVSHHLEKLYGGSLTPLQFDEALPGFGDLEQPSLRFYLYDSGKPDIAPMLMSCGMHPSAPIGRRAIEATTRAQVRPQRTRSRLGAEADLASGPVCGRR